MQLTNDNQSHKCDVYENERFYFIDSKTQEYIRDEDGNALRAPQTGVKAAIRFATEYSERTGTRIEIGFGMTDPYPWFWREANRLRYGAYKPIAPHILHKLERFSVSETNTHFLHISKDGQSVAYTPDHKSGVLDRQVKTTFARYLTKFYSAHMSATEIRDFAATLTGAEYEITIGDTREEFRFAYENQNVKSPSSSFRSCMSYHQNDRDHFARNLPCHPAEVYAAGDLAIAYIKNPSDDDSVLARTILHKRNQTYGKIYVAIPALHQITAQKLGAMGYTHNCEITGARLLRIEYGGGKYVMPFLDGDGDYTHQHSDEHFVVGERDGDEIGRACETNGTMEAKPQFRCESCGDAMDEDDARTVYVRRHVTEDWCEHCHDNNSFWCEMTNETYSDSTFTYVVVINRSGYEMSACLEVCRDDIFRCENTDKYYAARYYTAIEVETSSGTETWCSEECDDYFTCEHAGINYSANDYTAITVNTTGGTETWCAEEESDYCFLCDDTHEFYSKKDFNQIVVRNLQGEDETWCETENDDAYFWCEYMNMNLVAEFRNEEVKNYHRYLAIAEYARIAREAEIRQTLGIRSLADTLAAAIRVQMKLAA